MNKLTMLQALEGTEVTTAAMIASPIPHMEFPELVRKLQLLKMIPKGDTKLLILELKGTSFANPLEVAEALQKFQTGAYQQPVLELEPDNPKPPAIRLTLDGRKMGYIEKGVAVSLVNFEYQCAGILEFIKVPEREARFNGGHRICILVGYRNKVTVPTVNPAK